MARLYNISYSIATENKIYEKTTQKFLIHSLISLHFAADTVVLLFFVVCVMIFSRIIDAIEGSRYVIVKPHVPVLTQPVTTPQSTFVRKIFLKKISNLYEFPLFECFMW